MPYPCPPQANIEHTSNPPASLLKHRYPALDGLRGLAVLIVVLHHFFIHKAPFSSGWFGVDIFFVLSGFLITGILYDSRDKPHRLRDFYMRRALRILPLYYGVWLLILLATPIFHWHWDRIWMLWPLHLGNYTRLFGYGLHATSQHENLFDYSSFAALRKYLPYLSVGHFWTLCVEEQFYFLWPFLVFRLRSRRAILRATLVVILLTPLLRVALLFTLSPHVLAGDFLYTATFTRADAFMYGGVLALLLRDPEQHFLQRHRIRISVAVLAFCGICLAAFFHWSPVNLLSTTDPLVSTIGFCLIDLFAAMLLLNALHAGSWIYRTLNLSPLRWLGSISYGVYVFHLMILPVTTTLAGPFPILLHFRAILGFLATLALAQLSYTFYERPFLRLKDRFTAQVHRTPAV